MRGEHYLPLSAHTRYRIGGPAARFARPADGEALRAVLAGLEGAPHLTLGTGANLLVSDRGVGEAVLVLGEGFGAIDVGRGAIVAGAAARMPALAGEARRSGLEGLWFLEAVPGTLGGGLRMNAGTREDWVWSRVEWAEAMDPTGRTHRLRPPDVAPGYRRVGMPAEWVFTRARLETPPGDRGAIERQHLSFRARKVADQVYDLPSIGSTWKNPGPPWGSAWQVVDRVGMRGARRGDAQVAERHANFIVNLGDARAADVLWLMAETRRRAAEDLGVELEAEVRLWGFDGEERASVGAGPEGAA